MRPYKKLVIFLLCAIVCSARVFAHSGRTDANGGHNSASGYHYHHGYPAHQHTGGVCPYDFDDRTGWSSGEPSSGSDTSYSRTPNTIPSQNNYTPSSNDGSSHNNTSTKTEQPKDEPSWLQEHAHDIFFWAAVVFAIIVAYVTIMIATHCKNKKIQREWNLKREELITFFDGQSARQKANVPEDVGFNSHHWPIDNPKQRFISNARSNKFHKPTCRYAAGTPVPWYRLPKHFTPCKVCKPIRPAYPQWLTDYRNYIQAKKEYKIPDPDIPSSDV